MRGGPRDGGIGDEATDQALRALAEPRRRAILRLVAHDELPAGEIAAAFDVTRTAISQHLTVLRHCGAASPERRDGTRRLYRARPEGLAGLGAVFWTICGGNPSTWPGAWSRPKRGISEAAIDPRFSFPLIPRLSFPLIPRLSFPLIPRLSFPSGPAPLLPSGPCVLPSPLIPRLSFPLPRASPSR